MNNNVGRKQNFYEYFDISIDANSNKVNFTYINSVSKYFKISLRDIHSLSPIYSFNSNFEFDVNYWCIPEFKFSKATNFKGFLIEFYNESDSLEFSTEIYIKDIIESKNKLLESTHINLNDMYRGHFNVTYRGVPYLKCPMDYVIYQMIIHKVKPDLIIEVGSYRGGGAFYYADILELIGKGRVHSINLYDEIYDTSILKHNRIDRFTGGFQNYDIEKNTQGFETVLIIDDGSHTYSDVLDSLNKFSSLVSKDSYFIVEDGVVSFVNSSAVYNGGPRRALREFLENNKNFEIDRYYCDFFGMNSTFNPDGYLRRIL